jgi:hypothetical protein
MMINNKPKHDEDSEPGSGVSRRDFIKITTGTVTCMSLGSLMLGCGSHGNGSTHVQGYPIDSNVYTTLERTVEPGFTSGAIAPQNLRRISEYDQNGYGFWSYGNRSFANNASISWVPIPFWEKQSSCHPAKIFFNFRHPYHG